MPLANFEFSVKFQLGGEARPDGNRSDPPGDDGPAPQSAKDAGPQDADKADGAPKPPDSNADGKNDPKSQDNPEKNPSQGTNPDPPGTGTVVGENSDESCNDQEVYRTSNNANFNAESKDNMTTEDNCIDAPTRGITPPPPTLNVPRRGLQDQGHLVELDSTGAVDVGVGSDPISNPPEMILRSDAGDSASLNQRPSIWGRLNPFKSRVKNPQNEAIRVTTTCDPELEPLRTSTSPVENAMTSNSNEDPPSPRPRIGSKRATDELNSNENKKQKVEPIFVTINSNNNANIKTLASSENPASGSDGSSNNNDSDDNEGKDDNGVNRGFIVSNPEMRTTPPAAQIDTNIKENDDYVVQNFTIELEQFGSIQFLGTRDLRALGDFIDISKMIEFRHGGIDVAFPIDFNKFPIFVTFNNMTRNDFRDQLEIAPEREITDAELESIKWILGQAMNATHNTYDESTGKWELLIMQGP